MGSFGGAVTSLLDTYTKCLAYLKNLNGGKQADESTSSLASALRKARSRVRRSYSSKLSHSGRSFEKGDTTSKSSLNGIIRKLSSTLTNLFNSHSKRQPRELDYGSLVSLCDSSRTDAIRTMSDLSTRLSNHSRSTVASRAASSGSRQSSRRHGHRRSSSSRHQASDAWRPERRRSSASSQSRRKRVSRLTMSTNSTKLGEVRRRDDADQRKHTAYPRRLQAPYPRYENQRKKKKWWNIF